MDIKKILLSAATITGILTAGTIAANADTVTVKAGDTVSHIASANNTTVSAIEKANSLSNVNLIFVGQQLEVGGDANNAASTQQATTETPQAPAANAQPAQQQQPKAQAPVASAQPAQQQAKAQAPAASAQPAQQQTQNSTPAANTQPAQQQVSTSSASTSNSSSSEESAKAWIANRESGGSYSATNGQYYGKYQLSKSYLNGDYSAANQERVAEQYVQQRYGSWANAQKHSQETGWY
ncbi:aggregation promoting factor [Liquorilactobacillus sucicola DSM 21376 = JCM 15457]|uniref:Peptidoglycan binding protein, lysm domain protein n=1 Tax=Liquorilactobacillus sucicola DSM 21376 = JCM 15457 TaxID=1423806 RepID=A0A023CXP8_9LACO|nr:LysM peptidoglycan-binding domain-containing protein [Liquorilactobacillus sucicola]KRN07153.1 peptidoglycan binding protein, lysm domain protein [Liquorilactobacillus sucicola DSM 21376 = JCM 15457]GAJ26652.1 aggregation promoting factor [Liquorilactobacillus sucicola DSM 21376 = JCM 15457]